MPVPVYASASSLTAVQTVAVPRTVSPTRAVPRIIPVVGYILGLIVRFGVPHVVKIFGNTALKKALRSKLIARNANTWTHIMQPRRNWHIFGAQGNWGKVADLLTNTVANEKKYPRGAGADQFEWVHKGKRIVAVVSKKTGEISDGRAK